MSTPFKNPSLTPARIVATVAVVVLWAGPLWWAKSHGWSVEKLQSLAQVLAILATASFFAYKAVVGFFITNASLSVNVRRSSASPVEDFLGVTVSVEKGDRGTLVLHDLRIRTTPEGAEPIDTEVTGVQRLSTGSVGLPANGSRPIERLEVRLGERSRTAPFLHLSPGEATHFSLFVRVPKDAACLVEAVLIGRKPSDRPVGQWRASTVSFSVDRDRNAG